MQLVALVVNRVDQARIREASLGEGDVAFCQYVSDLAPLVLAKAPFAVLVEPVDARGAPVAPAVEAIRAASSGLPIFAYGEFRRDTAIHFMALARAGVTEMVSRGDDDLRPRLAAARADAHWRAVAELVLARLGRDTTEPVRVVLRCFFEHTDEPSPVGRAAATLGLHRRTLVYRMSKAGMPAPSALASWCRLLLAARELDSPGRSVERAAIESSFASATALRNMLKRYTGLSPAQLRALGGFSHLVDLFVAFLHESRHAEVPPPAIHSVELASVTRFPLYVPPRVRPTGLLALLLPLPRSVALR